MSKSKISLKDKIESLKDSRPELANIDWGALLREDPSLLEDVTRGIIENGRGKRADSRERQRRFSVISDSHYSDVPFPRSFSLLCGEETLRETAAKLDRSYANIFNLKAGTAQPSIELMEVIARAYSCKPSYFLEYRVYKVLSSMEEFLMNNPETASSWFSKIDSQIRIR